MKWCNDVGYCHNAGSGPKCRTLETDDKLKKAASLLYTEHKGRIDNDVIINKWKLKT